MRMPRPGTSLGSFMRNGVSTFDDHVSGRIGWSLPPRPALDANRRSSRAARGRVLVRLGPVSSASTGGEQPISPWTSYCRNRNGCNGSVATRRAGAISERGQGHHLGTLLYRDFGTRPSRPAYKGEPRSLL